MQKQDAAYSGNIFPSLCCQVQDGLRIQALLRHLPRSGACTTRGPVLEPPLRRLTDLSVMNTSGVADTGQPSLVGCPRFAF